MRSTGRGIAAAHRAGPLGGDRPIVLACPPIRTYRRRRRIPTSCWRGRGPRGSRRAWTASSWGGHGPAGTFLPGRDGEALSYRQILIDRAPEARARGGHHDAAETARGYLHRLAVLMTSHRVTRAWLDAHGRDPEDEVLSAFLDRLRRALRPSWWAAKRRGFPRDLRAGCACASRARRRRGCRTRSTRSRGHAAPARPSTRSRCCCSGGATTIYAGAVTAATPRSPERSGRPAAAARSCDDRLHTRSSGRRGARAPGEQLRLPAWQFALGTLDESLSRLAADAPDGTGAAEERVAFRVLVLGDGALNVEPCCRSAAAAPPSRAARACSGSSCPTARISRRPRGARSRPMTTASRAGRAPGAAR